MVDPGNIGPGREQQLLRFMTRLNLLVASNLDLTPILEGIVQETVALFGADEGCIRLADPENLAGVTMVRTAVHSGSWPRPIALAVMGFVAGGHPALVTPDLLDDGRFPALRGEDSRIRAVLAVPLAVRGRVNGVLAISEAEPGRAWTENEAQLLALAGQRSGEAIAAAREREARVRLEQEAEEARRILEAMKKARAVQMGLVPSQPLLTAGWEVSGQVVPASRVGGDLFDFFPAGDGVVGLVLADIEGKGLDAAIMMAVLKGALVEIARARVPVAEALDRVNRAMAGLGERKTATMFYGQFDAASGILTYSSAGHPPAMVRRGDGSIELLEERGPLMGLFDAFEYPQGEAVLGPGDSLLLYSDGIPDALDLADEFFGLERLQAAWSQVGGCPACEALVRVLGAVEAFRGRAPQSDDITLVALGRPRG